MTSRTSVPSRSCCRHCMSHCVVLFRTWANLSWWGTSTSGCTAWRTSYNGSSSWTTSRSIGWASAQNKRSWIHKPLCWKLLGNSSNANFHSAFCFLQPTSTGMTLIDLPDSLQLNIMHRLSDGRDLVSLGQVCPELGVLTEDRLLWKKLCQYHFTDRQVG